MIGILGVRAGVVAVIAAAVLQSGPASAQLVDTPNNLIKAWQDAFASRNGEPMTRVYARDAQLVGLRAKEPSIGIDSIKQHYERTGQAVSERSATVAKVQFLPRKRITVVTGVMDVRSRLKDGSASNSQTRFTMTIIRESRRQWSILSHHISVLPQ